MRSKLLCGPILLLAALFALAAAGQPSARGSAAPAKPSSAGTAPALFISDIHFDPFHDPQKAAQLAAAPIGQWDHILSQAASPDHESAFLKLQLQCGARGVDTPYSLLQSSLAAMRASASGARFILVSGDLLAHHFDCRYRKLLPGQPDASYAAFVEKTLQYVSAQLRQSLPAIPIYIALGNNDTACGDYRLDAAGPFLASAAKVVAGTVPRAQQGRVSAQFLAGGYYAVPLPPPMRNAQLIVLNDVLLSKGYLTCGGQESTAAGTAELQWLAAELARARREKRRVWIMGHIPPGIDVYSTLKKGNTCGGTPPESFLRSEEMVSLLARYADVIQLAVFAHTHMDEFRLLAAGGKARSPDSAIPIKLVPSVSPVDGNRPAFLVAQLSAASAQLQDYSVYVDPDSKGASTSWPLEYTFSKTYSRPRFSAEALQDLIARFQSTSFEDPKAKAYIKLFYPGFVPVGVALPLVWPEYKCGFSNLTVQQYTACVCPAAK